MTESVVEEYGMNSRYTIHKRQYYLSSLFAPFRANAFTHAYVFKCTPAPAPAYYTRLSSTNSGTMLQINLDLQYYNCIRNSIRIQ